jgi:hypothetical protein
MGKSQLERLKGDVTNLDHYIYKLKKQGKELLAFKISQKREFLLNNIQSLT